MNNFGMIQQNNGKNYLKQRKYNNIISISHQPTIYVI